MARPWLVLSAGGCRSDVVRQESVKGRSEEAGGTGSSQTRDAERSDRAGSGGGSKRGLRFGCFWKTGQRDLLRDWREGSRERERRKFEEDHISFPRLLQQHQALVA